MTISLIEKRQEFRKNIIFHQIRNNNNMLSRNDITKTTKFSMTSVSIIVDKLIHEGLILENISNDTRVGRRPVLLSIKRDSIYFAGIECNSALVDLTILDALGEVYYRETLYLNNPLAEDILLGIEKILNTFMINNPNVWNKIYSITIGLPGRVDRKNGIGISYFSVNNWINIDVKSFVTNYYKKTFYFTNNVDSMIIGYNSINNIKANDNYTILLITIRNGIGIRLYSKGLLLSDYGAICEFGHMQIANSNRMCSCGKKGCYDSEVTIPALFNKISEALNVNKLTNLLLKCEGDSSKITLDMFFEEVKNGDVDACEIFRDIAVYIGDLLSQILLVFAPDEIVLSTEMNKVQSLFKNIVESTLNHRPNLSQQNMPSINYSLPLNSLSSLGSAIISYEKTFSVKDNIM